VSDGEGSEPRVTDRGAWRLVARRDFRVRLRDKGFLISTSITMAVFTVFILLRAFGGGGTPTYDLGTLGDGSRSIGDLAARAAPSPGVWIHVHAVADRAAASRALAAGTLDAVLIDGDRLLVQEQAPDPLRTAVQTAVVADRIGAALGDAGLSGDAVSRVLSPSPVPVDALHPVDPDRDANATVAFVAVLLLYGQLFGYGVWVATGVIEEKSSRVVEILLSTIRARQLLAGKIAGIGVLGLLQLLFIATYGIALAGLTGALEVPLHATGTAVLAVGWFVLGFAFYASLFAVAGSLVSRMEELQNAIVPLNLLILASFFVSIGAVQDPGSPLAVAASIVPFSSALAMPVRIALGSATGPQIVLALAVLIGSTLALIPLAGRLYAGAVLQTSGRVKLRDAWRAAG
jgi:ABC-2 type transport system permease protein